MDSTMLGQFSTRWFDNGRRDRTSTKLVSEIVAGFDRSWMKTRPIFEIVVTITESRVSSFTLVQRLSSVSFSRFDCQSTLYRAHLDDYRRMEFPVIFDWRGTPNRVINVLWKFVLTHENTIQVFFRHSRVSLGHICPGKITRQRCCSPLLLVLIDDRWKKYSCRWILLSRVVAYVFIGNSENTVAKRNCS